MTKQELIHQIELIGASCDIFPSTSVIILLEQYINDGDINYAIHKARSDIFVRRIDNVGCII